MSGAEKIEKHVGMGVTRQRYVCTGCTFSVEAGRMNAIAGSKAIFEAGWGIVYFEGKFYYGLACPTCVKIQTAEAT